MDGIFAIVFVKKAKIDHCLVDAAKTGQYNHNEMELQRVTSRFHRAHGWIWIIDQSRGVGCLNHPIANCWMSFAGVVR